MSRLPFRASLGTGLVIAVAATAAVLALPPAAAGPAHTQDSAAKTLTKLDDEWSAAAAARDVSISWKTSHAEVSRSGELGFTAGTYEASFKGPDGGPLREKGKYLCTWKLQQDGTWKATHDMWNADTKQHDPGPPATPVRVERQREP